MKNLFINILCLLFLIFFVLPAGAKAVHHASWQDIHSSWYFIPGSEVPTREKFEKHKKQTSPRSLFTIDTSKRGWLAKNLSLTIQDETIYFLFRSSAEKITAYLDNKKLSPVDKTGDRFIFKVKKPGRKKISS